MDCQKGDGKNRPAKGDAIQIYNIFPPYNTWMALNHLDVHQLELNKRQFQIGVNDARGVQKQGTKEFPSTRRTH